MQHSKSHTVLLIHAAAAAALLMLVGMVLSIGTLSAHAIGSAVGVSKSAVGTPLGGPPPTQKPAQTQNQAQPALGSGETIANPLRYDSLNTLLDAVLSAAIQIGGIVLTIALVWVGFKFVAARGNEEKIRSARTALMWTIIGGLILLGATAIKAVITSTVGAITT